MKGKKTETEVLIVKCKMYGCIELPEILKSLDRLQWIQFFL